MCFAASLVSSPTSLCHSLKYWELLFLTGVQAASPRLFISCSPSFLPSTFLSVSSSTYRKYTSSAVWKILSWDVIETN